MMNFSFVFGYELETPCSSLRNKQRNGRKSDLGTHRNRRPVSNSLYCIYMLTKNRTWSVFREGNPPAYGLPGLLMGLLWFGGTVLCGMGAASLGALGGIVGWPIFMTIDIIAALFWGAVSGEWQGVSRRALVYNWAGVGALLVAIAVISAGNAT